MKRKIILNDEKIEVDIKSLDSNSGDVKFIYDGEEYSFSRKSHITNREVTLTDNKNEQNSHFVFLNDRVVIDGLDVVIQHDIFERDKIGGADAGSMTSPMPGKILKVFVKVNDEVKLGEPLIVMEAMKMEHTIKAANAGKISTINCEEGQLVDGGLALVEIQEES